MFFCPFYDNYFRLQTNVSHVRIFHASPDAPAVDVYANNALIARNLSYRGFTEYLPIAPGTYVVEVFRAGTKSNPVIQERVVVPQRAIVTLAAKGYLSNISLQAISDNRLLNKAGHIAIKFVHLSPNTPAVDVTLYDGTMLFSNVSYSAVASYVEVPMGTYNFQVKMVGTDKNILLVPNIKLRPNRAYTIYAIGLLESQPTLQVIVALDGSSYIR